MKRPLLVLVLFLAVVLYANDAAAIQGVAVSPGSFGVAYNVGQTTELSIYVEASPNEELQLLPSGELGQFLEIPNPILILDENGRGRATVKFTVPVIDTPGDHSAEILITERPPPRLFGEPGPLIVTLAAVSVPVKFYVPCPDRCIGLTFSTQDTDLGQPALFSAQISNLGSKDISSLSGHIEILDSTNATVATIPFASAGTLAPGGSTILHSEWDTAGTTAGIFTARAVVLYDEFYKDATGEFKVGDISIKAYDISPKQFFKGKVVNVFIRIESLWNKPIRHVYAVLDLKNDQGDELAHGETPPLSSMDPWSKSDLNAWLDVQPLSVGNYTLGVTVLYDNGNSTVYFPVSIVEAEVAPPPEMPKAQFKLDVTILAIVLLVSLILVLAYLEKTKRRKARPKYF